MLLRSSKPERNISIPSQYEAIHETIESHDLDKQRLLVVGGSALSLSGIRTATDVDILIPGQDFVDLAVGKTPLAGHTVYNEKDKPSYTLRSDSGMGIDFISNFDPSLMSIDEYDTAFVDDLNQQLQTKDGLYYASPEFMLARYRRIHKDPKTKRDMALVKSYLKSRR